MKSFVLAALTLAAVGLTTAAGGQLRQRVIPAPAKPAPPDPLSQLDYSALAQLGAPPSLPVTQASGFADAQPPKADDKGPKTDPMPTGAMVTLGGADGAERPVTVALTQKLVIRPDRSKGRLLPENVVIDRPELFSPIVLKDGTRPFRVSPDGTSLELIGVRLGVTRVRVFNPDKPDDMPYTVTVQIVPDIDYLNRLVKARFPMANLLVSAAGDNLLFVDGQVENPGDVEEVEKLLSKFFSNGVVSNIKVAGVMQVQLEVVIARVDRTHLRQLGVNVLVNNQQSFFGSQIGALIAAPQVTLPTMGSKVFAPVGPAGPPLNAGATAFFGVTDQSKAIFGFIEALRQQNVAKILANPTLVTLSGRQADFLVGGEQPIPVSGTIVSPTVNFKAFGTRLTFLPTVLGGGRIRLDVVPEVSTTNFANSITVGGLQVPQFVVQRVHATVELQSGQTLCLGGLLQSEVEAQSQKVPVLGELPWIGGLFRRVRHRTVESELLVLVTPRLFNPLDACQTPQTLPGQQTISPTDAQLFTHGALESARRDGPPLGPHQVPVLGDQLGATALPTPVTACGAGAHRTLIDAVCPQQAAPAQPQAAPLPPPAPLPMIPPRSP